MKGFTASLVAFAITSCTAQAPPPHFDEGIATVCANLALASLAKGEWRLGPKDAEFRTELANIQRAYVETGRDTSSAVLVTKYASAFLEECTRWVKARGYPEACGHAPLGTVGGGECWSAFLGASRGNDLDWVLTVSLFDKTDISKVVRGSWSRASREIEVCGFPGCGSRR